MPTVLELKKSEMATHMLDQMEIASSFGMSTNVPSTGGEGPAIGSPSDYILIAMIVAMMLCMILCCFCLFCRSSSRLSVCGVNFEVNDRRNSVEHQSEIHEVVPLTPTTAGDYNNRLPDIESMLKGDAPPLYNEIVKKTQEAQDNEAKATQSKGSVKSAKKKPQSESSSTRSNRSRGSWRFSGRGIIASFRAKSSILRSQKSDSAIQCPTVEEGVVMSTHRSAETSPSLKESASQPRAEIGEEVTVETVDEIVRKTESEKKQKKVFVYNANDLSPDDDDDVFL